jgi:hypothetical protein
MPQSISVPNYTRGCSAAGRSPSSQRARAPQPSSFGCPMPFYSAAERRVGQEAFARSARLSGPNERVSCLKAVKTNSELCRDFRSNLAP